jgi:hypothetical protein
VVSVRSRVQVIVLAQQGNKRLAVGGRLHEDIHEGELLGQMLVAAHAHHAAHDGDGFVGMFFF